jgi:hypothetical protein
LVSRTASCWNRRCGDYGTEPLKKAADCKNKVQRQVAKIKPALEKTGDKKGILLRIPTFRDAEESGQ